MHEVRGGSPPDEPHVREPAHAFVDRSGAAFVPSVQRADGRVVGIGFLRSLSGFPRNGAQERHVRLLLPVKTKKGTVVRCSEVDRVLRMRPPFQSVRAAGSAPTPRPRRSHPAAQSTRFVGARAPVQHLVALCRIAFVIVTDDVDTANVVGHHVVPPVTVEFVAPQQRLLPPDAVRRLGVRAMERTGRLPGKGIHLVPVAEASTLEQHRAVVVAHRSLPRQIRHDYRVVPVLLRLVKAADQSLPGLHVGVVQEQSPELAHTA